MKNKHLLTSIASALLLATGSIVVAEGTDKTTDKTTEKEAEVKKTEAEWKYKGQVALYYQTADAQGNGSLFDQGPADGDTGWAKATAGFQLNATNKDLGNGIGAGFELTGVSSLGLHKHIVSGLVQNAGGTTDGFTSASLNQAYLTYAYDKTSYKLGRQELPKSLSPFAFTEGWNLFKNSFDAGLVVNSDIENTTLVYAYVMRRNNSVGNLNDFSRFYQSDAVHLITAQNTSIENLTLTGSFYQVPDATDAGDAHVYWLDGQYKNPDFTIAFQGGTIGGSAVAEDNSGYGFKVSGKLGGYKTSFAYSSADDGSLNIANLAGEGVKSPLYTQTILNQNTVKRDSDTVKFDIAMAALDGTFVFVYANSDLGDTALPSVFGTGVGGAGAYQEVEFIYKRSLGENTKLFMAYINQNDDRQVDENQNFFRIWARYNF